MLLAHLKAFTNRYKRKIGVKGLDSINNHPQIWQKALPRPHAASHKYSRGLVMLCGGDSMTGAAVLAARAAMRLGAGILKLASPAKTANLYRQCLISAIVCEYRDYKEFCDICADPRINTYIIGPGRDDNGLKQQILHLLALQKPLLLDAGGLNVFADDLDTLRQHTHQGVVVSPHEQEFNRLFASAHINIAHLGRIGAAQKATEILPHATLLLKGAETIIAQQSKPMLINRHASPYLASAGTGDVLAGMVAALLGGGMPAYLASAAAVWLHAQAGLQLGAGLIAEDLPQAAQKIWCHLITDSKGQN